jgi:hypothetical protein
MNGAAIRAIFTRLIPPAKTQKFPAPQTQDEMKKRPCQLARIGGVTKDARWTIYRQSLNPLRHVRQRRGCGSHPTLQQ